MNFGNIAQGFGQAADSLYGYNKGLQDTDMQKEKFNLYKTATKLEIDQRNYELQKAEHEFKQATTPVHISTLTQNPDIINMVYSLGATDENGMIAPVNWDQTRKNILADEGMRTHLFESKKQKWTEDSMNPDPQIAAQAQANLKKLGEVEMQANPQYMQQIKIKQMELDAAKEKKDIYKTPLPTTDAGWTVSANNEGVTVARIQSPTGQIVEQPYDVTKHGRIVKPEEGVGLANNPTVGLTGEAALANYTPQVQTIAKKLVKGEIPYPSAFALKDALWKTIIQAASDLDPGFNAQQYQIRAATRKSFTSGVDAKNVTSINTLVGHLASLKKSAESLDNTKFQVWNKLTNMGITQFGDSRVTKFNMDLGAVESELATVFKQTGATDQEIKAWRERINDAQSPEQLRTNIVEAVSLMGSRLEALHNKYTTAMGPFSTFQILSTRSKKVLSDLVGKETVDQMEPDMPTEESISAGGTSQAGAKKIIVQDPSGKKFWLPENQLQQAIQQGYKRVQ